MSWEISNIVYLQEQFEPFLKNDESAWFEDWWVFEMNSQPFNVINNHDLISFALIYTLITITKIGVIN